MVYHISNVKFLCPHTSKLSWSKTSYNGSVLKNPEISGALYTLRIQYKYTQIQCEDGARDFRVKNSDIQILSKSLKRKVTTFYPV